MAVGALLGVAGADGAEGASCFVGLVAADGEIGVGDVGEEFCARSVSESSESSVSFSTDAESICDWVAGACSAEFWETADAF